MLAYVSRSIMRSMLKVFIMQIILPSAARTDVCVFYSSTGENPTVPDILMQPAVTQSRSGRSGQGPATLFVRCGYGDISEADIAVLKTELQTFLSSEGFLDEYVPFHGNGSFPRNGRLLWGGGFLRSLVRRRRILRRGRDVNSQPVKLGLRPEHLSLTEEDDAVYAAVDVSEQFHKVAVVLPDQLGIENIHLRRADEACHKEVGRVVEHLLGRAHLLRSPRRSPAASASALPSAGPSSGSPKYS